MTDNHIKMPRNNTEIPTPIRLTVLNDKTKNI